MKPIIPKESETNILAFLKAVPLLQQSKSQMLLTNLATQFNIHPDTLTLLIHIAFQNGGISEN